MQIKQDEVTHDLGPGDPNLHTHFLIPNAVFVPSSATEPARVGPLDTAPVGGFIFEADAFYHARLAEKLRDAGFEAQLDRKSGAARMPIISDEMRDLFSKRTNSGEALVRQVATEEGVNWDELTPHQRATREKNATQSYEQKQKGGKDDVADAESWLRQAKDTLDWEPPATMQLYGPQLPSLTDEQRIRHVYETALPYLADKLEQSSVIKHYDLRIAALRGLTETGIQGGLKDVEAVTRLMAQEGVIQNGEKTELVWGHEPVSATSPSPRACTRPTSTNSSP